MMMPPMQHPAFASAISRQLWMSAAGNSYRPRPRMQYSQGQIDSALLDVEMGKSISRSAKDNGVPFTSLYRRVKARSVQQSEDEPSQQPLPVPMDDSGRREESSSVEEAPFPVDAVFEDPSPEQQTAEGPLPDENPPPMDEFLSQEKDLRDEDSESTLSKFDMEDSWP